MEVGYEGATRTSSHNGRPGRSLVVFWALILIIGVGLSAYPWITDMWAARLQTSLAGDLDDDPRGYRLGLLEDGDALMHVRAPDVDIDVMVVEGTTDQALRAGAGHYRESDLPEEDGNVALAGHRTTYGRPFNRIDDLRAGDEIYVTTPLGRYVYVVERRPWVVLPSDWSPVKKFPEKGSFLTLMSCHPEGSATYRIVVRARLERSMERELLGDQG